MPLIGYWPLNEDSGSTAYDYSGNGYNGTIYGPTLGSGGVLGNTSFSFDASNSDYISVGRSAISPDWTAMAWFKIRDNGNNNIRFLNGPDFSLRYGAQSNIDEFGYTEYDVADYTFNVKNGLGDGQWVHAAWVGEGSNILLYVNGEKKAEETPSNPISCPLETIGSSGTQTLEGEIAEVRIYGHALSASEVQYLYSVAKKGTYVSRKKVGIAKPSSPDSLSLDS